MDYKLQAEADSMLNTPPTYSMYIAGLVFKWVKQQGGIREVEKRNIERPRCCTTSSIRAASTATRRKRGSFTHERALYAKGLFPG